MVSVRLLNTPVVEGVFEADSAAVEVHGSGLQETPTFPEDQPSPITAHERLAEDPVPFLPDPLYAEKTQTRSPQRSAFHRCTSPGSWPGFSPAHWHRCTAARPQHTMCFRRRSGQAPHWLAPTRHRLCRPETFFGGWGTEPRAALARGSDATTHGRSPTRNPLGHPASGRAWESCCQALRP